MDQLAEAGVVGEEEGTKPRKVLMSMEEFEELRSRGIRNCSLKARRMRAGAGEQGCMGKQEQRLPARAAAAGAFE